MKLIGGNGGVARSLAGEEGLRCSEFLRDPSSLFLRHTFCSCMRVFLIHLEIEIAVCITLEEDTVVRLVPFYGLHGEIDANIFPPVLYISNFGGESCFLLLVF